MSQYKSVKGYKGLYEISSDGEVISLYFGKRKTMKPALMTSGYLFVNLKKNGVQKNHTLHRLLAQHFLPNPKKLKQVNHKDGNKINNNIDNLEWCSREENMQHMYDTGLKTYRPLHYKGKTGALHNRSKKVRCIETGEVFGSMSEAERKMSLGQGSVGWSVRNKAPIFGVHWEIAT